ncbi:MAG: prolipoprotein diacylglyceryl transferase [Pseudomonadota bacterium]
MLSLLAASADAAGPLMSSDYSLGPSLFKIGWFELRYYSLAYLIGVIFSYWHVSKMIKQPGAPMAQRHVDDLFFYCTLGVIVGGRLGYAAFYTGGASDTPSVFFDFTGNSFLKWKLLEVWEGGMAFHGGLIGVVVAAAFVCWRNKLSYLRVGDYIAVTVPMGMLLGRLANFNNGELWGRKTDVPWGMVFSKADEAVRHPSQLYQAGLEGLALLIILTFMFWKTRARYRPGLLMGVFILGMGLARFTNEFFREPDRHLSDFAMQTGLSMGQWLTIPLIVIGLIVTFSALKKQPVGTGSAKAAQTA